MKKESFTREHYVGIWSEILSTYQYWGHELITILDEIKKTNPIAVEVFEKMYNKEGDSYVSQTFTRAARFYQKLDRLIPSAEELYTKLRVKSLNRENKNLAIKETLRLRRINYLIAILCFMEEFAMLSLKKSKVFSSENILVAHTENIHISIERDNKTEITVVKIIIPREISIEYYSSVKPIK